VHLSVLYVSKKYNYYQQTTALETEKENVCCAVPAEYLNTIQVIFTENQNQFAAQYFFLFVVKSPTRFGVFFAHLQGVICSDVSTCGYNCCCVYNY
jgi:hypothetical protein